MDPILDVFSGDAFTVQSLTGAINIVPNTYGRVSQLGLFRDEPIKTTSVAVEYQNGRLVLVQTQERGAPAPVNKDGKRLIKTFTVPHAPLDDRVLAAEIQNIRSFGSGSKLMSVMEKVNAKLAAMAANHHITWEYWKMGALKGLVLDADGSTILDLFAEFGVTPKVVNFALGIDSTDVAAKCREVARHTEDNLLGEVMTQIGCFCGPNFFDALTNHPEVIAAYQAQDGNAIKKEDLRRRFVYQGIVFEEYRGRAVSAAGTTYQFVGDDDARFFPIGTQNTFVNHIAPADFIETVNTMGLPLYAKQAVDAKYQRFVEPHTQSNHLPICHRPALLVKGEK